MGLIFHDMFSGTYKFTVYRKFLYTVYLNEIKKILVWFIFTIYTSIILKLSDNIAIFYLY